MSRFEHAADAGHSGNNRRGRASQDPQPRRDDASGARHAIEAKRLDCSVSQFDQDRLMIGRVGLVIDFDAENPASQIFGRENEIATIRTVGPLHVIV